MQRGSTSERRKKRIVYPVSLSSREIELLDDITQKRTITRAQAIREAIKAYADDIKGLEVIKLRSVSEKEARREILEYLEQHDRALTSEIADSLRLDILFVNKILEELWSEERVEQHSSKSN